MNQETAAPAPQSSPRAWIGYVVPMAAFMALTALEGQGTGIPYPVFYTIKVAIVTAALLMSRKVWKEIHFDPKMLALGLIVGLVGYLEWIYVDRHTPHFRFLGTRTAFNPGAELPERNIRHLFLLVRFFGLAIMVPVMEEIFWRSFLLRWITDPDFTKLKVGEFSWSAFAVVAGIFAISHPEWLAAAIFAAMMALLLKRTGSLFACIVAHGFTNLLLGIYLIQTHSWMLW